MMLPTEAELIELENSISYWDDRTRDRIQVLIDIARAQLPPIPPMPPTPPLHKNKWRWQTKPRRAVEQ